MKSKLVYILFVITFIVSCNQSKQTKLVMLKSNAENIKYLINGNKADWRIAPEVKPDVLKVECVNELNAVAFISENDSIKFDVKLHDTINFIVLLKGRDTAYTQIIGIDKNAHFTDAYIKEHNGKFEVDIPEVHELANVLVAISKIGQLDSNMVDMTSAYYQKVKATFLPFANHAAIEVINKNITKIMEDYSYGYYYALKMNACGYEFNGADKIINKGIVYHMGFNSPDDPFILNSDVFADFAKVSNFRAFYKANKTYYDSLIKDYRQLNPIDKMQKWLEGKFKFSYGNYCVYFSPLVGGAHATTRFSDNGFEQTYMFVCSAQKYPNYNANENEMLNSRIVFTEIDHNFVNPISDKNAKRINLAFANRQKWVQDKESNGTSMYGSPYAVFNEYMTFAVYSLYCLDNFTRKDALKFIKSMENLMANGRSFINFKAFNQHLISIYEANKNIEIDAMYEQMLNWCDKQ